MTVDEVVEPVESAEAFIARKEAQFRRQAARPVATKDIGRRGRDLWHRENGTLMRQTNHPHKVVVIERFRYLLFEGERAYAGAGAREGDIEYRFGYFMVGRIGNMRGKWTWGQYSPLIPAADLPLLLDKARREGTVTG